MSKNALNQQEALAETKERELPAELPGPEYKMKLVWRNIIIFAFLHIGAVYGYMTPKNSWSTIIFSKSQHLHRQRFVSRKNRQSDVLQLPNAK
jgi:hypothetical protein